MSEKTKEEEIEPSWEEPEVIAEKLNVQARYAERVIYLLDSGATIPFIARYRKEQTGDMPPDKLREVASMVEDLRAVKTKMKNVYSAISGQGKMTEKLKTSLRYSQTMEELEMLFAPFKPGHKGSLAERAKAVGLEPPALMILDGKMVNFNQFVKPSEKGAANVKEVETGIQHIIADIISKDKETMEEIRKICATSNVVLETTKTKTKAAADKKDDGGKKVKKEADSVKVKKGGGKVKAEPPDNSHKYEQYFSFSCPIRSLKPHQVLAINRGEEQKVLSVKITMPDSVKLRFTRFAHQKFIGRNFPQACTQLIENSIEDSFNRLIQPQMCRHIRSEQTKAAEKASIAVFADNLHHLLLISPVKGKTVLGIDPGFTNGCKSAVISPTGDILETQVLYLQDFKSNKFQERQKVIRLVQTHRCDVIAIGNGKACRETEQLIADLIQSHAFGQQSVVYCIVDERGASVYSVSEEAQKELPDLDPTLRGAVSIARRLQDPLSELVKIEPRHIGVGMYQHDMPKAKLQTSLDSVVEECVSFVGVDLNTASHCLLRRVAGVGTAKAKKILEWRAKNGPFMNRTQLLSIKGFGEKSFEQCAGFVRVVHDQSQEPSSSEEVKQETKAKPGQKRKAETKAGGKAKKAKLKSSENINPLDATAVHPESYSVAERFMKDLGLSSSAIGQEDFITKVTGFTCGPKGVSIWAEKYGVGEPTMKLIVEAFSKPLNYDFRSDFQKPLFKKGMTSINDLQKGTVLTGCVSNTTHFGAFVDIGVGQDGLIHISNMLPGLCPSVGDHVEVKVISVDMARKRIGLKLLKPLTNQGGH